MESKNNFRWDFTVLPIEATKLSMVMLINTKCEVVNLFPNPE